MRGLMEMPPAGCHGWRAAVGEREAVGPYAAGEASGQRAATVASPMVHFGGRRVPTIQVGEAR